MKKSTILILLVIYLGSVLIVGIFGMKSIPFEERVYVDKITPTSVTSSTGETFKIETRTDLQDTYYVVVKGFTEGLTIIINYDLTPADCTDKNVKISIVEPDDPPATLSDRGEIIFSEKGSLHVVYKAEDSATGPKMDFWIYFR